MDFKKDLKLFQELKDEAYSEPDNSIEGLEKKIEIYDIDPNINNELLTILLDSSNPDFISKYYNLIQTLTFQQKIDLSKKLKSHPFGNQIKIVKDKSYIDCYFSILKKINKYEKKN